MEPERPIEKILRASAAARRRGEPGNAFPLHPVDRKILQAEVAKVYGSKAEPGIPERRSWGGLWAQFAWSFALVVGLALAVTMMLPRSGRDFSFTLAKNEQARPASAPAQSLDKNLPAQNTSRSLRDERETDRLQTLAAGHARETESHGVASGPAPPLSAGTAGEPKLEERFRSRYGLAPSSAPAPSSPGTVVTANEASSERMIKSKDTAGAIASAPLAAAESKVQTQVTNQMRSELALADSEKQLKRKDADTLKEAVAANSVSAVSGSRSTLALQTPPAAEKPVLPTIRQKFDQALPTGTVTETVAQSAAAAPAAILSNFDFEQTGSLVRIIDQDGSVYLGTTQLPPVLNRGFSNQALGGANVDGTSAYFFSQNSPATLFTVSGTNVTSGQLITFQGQLLGQPVNPLKATDTAKKPSSRGISNTWADSVLSYTNAQLTGKLNIGSNAPIQIRAHPIQRPK